MEHAGDFFTKTLQTHPLKLVLTLCGTSLAVGYSFGKN